MVKEPLTIDYKNSSIDEIVEQIEMAIEQHPSFLKVVPQEFIEQENELNKQRTYGYYNSSKNY